MGVLSLMAGLDEKFGLVLTDAEVKSMKSIGDILAVLRKHNMIDGTQ